MTAAPIARPPRRLRRRLRQLSLGLALAVLPTLTATTLTACKPAEAPRGPIDEDRRDAKIKALQAFLEKNPDDPIARRDLAHLYWLHRADAERAKPLLEPLAEGGDVIAQASLMLIAEVRLDAKAARRWAHAVIESTAELNAAGEDADEAPSRDQRRAARRRRRGGVQSTAALDPAIANGLAEAAARLLDERHGDLADDDENFVAFFEKLDRSHLPVEVTRPLLSQRAAIARRAEDPKYRDFYDAEGCVRAWTVGAIEGTHGELELRETPTGPIKADPEAVLTELSCVVRVWNPRPHAGARRLATSLEVPDGQLRLELSAQQPFRAYLDGALIYRSDRNDRWPARRVLLDAEVAPGTHRLELHVALPQNKAWILTRATDGQGRPVKAEAADPNPGTEPAGEAEVEISVAPFGADVPNLDPQIYGPWSRLLAVADALADGDSDRAERWLRQLDRYGPRFAEAKVMSARVGGNDPTRDRTTSAARERQALESALELDASLEAARVRLLELGLNRGEIAEVLSALQERPEGTLEHVPGDLVRFRAYLARGSESLAEAALDDAEERNPRSCEMLKLRRQLAQSRGDVAAERELIAASDHCPGTLTVRAGIAERSGDHREAIRLLEIALKRAPDDIDLLQGLAAVAIASEDYDRARGAYERVLKLNPFSSKARVALADLSARADDPKSARANLRASVAAYPSSSALHEIAAHLGIPDDIEALRIDGAPLIQAYVAADLHSADKEDLYEGASEVLVLDRSAARIYDDGSARQLVHTIAEVRTKEAIDRYGEMQIPEGARLLTFHSVKPSGEVIEPESISGKAGLSLRGLEIGDFVEFELLIDEEPHGYLPGYVDLSVFRFQSYNIPFHRSELVVMHPAAMPITIESRGDAPRAQQREEGDLMIQTWRVDQSQRRGVEPNARDSLDELPSVRVYTELDLPAWLDALALRVVHGQRSNPELRRLARAQTKKIKAKGPKGDAAKLRRLWSWVMENVEEAGDITVTATQTLAARKGNRLMLLRSLLRELGIRAEVWVGRDRFGPSLVEGGHPMPESYAAPLLMVWIDGEPTPVLTNSKVVPLGYLPVNLSESPALRLRLADDEPPSGLTTTPAVAESLQDLRRYDLELDLDGEGDGALRGTITLRGMEAIAWREGLRALDRDRLEEAFEQAELGILAQGASLDLLSLDIDNERALSKPLILRFEANVRGLGVRQGGDLLLRAALVPMNLGLGFAGLHARKTGLVIPYAPIQEAVVKLKLDGVTLRTMPDAATITTDAGGYTRAIDEGDDGVVTLRTRTRLRPGILEAADYGELVELTRGIRAAEDELFRAK